jgi:hypothetical protein
MSDTQAKLTEPGRPRSKMLLRIVTIIIGALCVGYAVRHASLALTRGNAPAGFYRGIIQGALMPCALPNLLMGNDVAIYALNNTGVPYKLGYTVGVNGCGAIFFGIFFWRLNRWRKKLGILRQP